MLKAAGRNVLIKPLLDEVTYKSTIILPDTARAKAHDGVVVDCGEWCTEVLPGDHVVFSRRQANDVEDDGVEYVIVDERAILVTIDHEESELNGD